VPLLQIKWSLLLHAIVDDWMIPLSVYTAVETPNAFRCDGRLPQNCSLPSWISTPSNTWFLGLTQVSPPYSISIGSAVSAGHIHVTNTQTDHTTHDICSNRPCLCNARDVAWKRIVLLKSCPFTASVWLTEGRVN